MFDFSALPPFLSRGALFKRIGVNSTALELSVGLVFLWFLLVGIVPWLGWLVGKVEVVNIWNELQMMLLSPSNLVYAPAPLYILYACVQIIRYQKRDPEISLFLHKGLNLLTRGDDLEKQGRFLQAAHRRIMRDGPPEPGSFHAFVLERLLDDWYSYRRAVWNLHTQQQQLRIQCSGAES